MSLLMILSRWPKRMPTQRMRAIYIAIRERQGEGLENPGQGRYGSDGFKMSLGFYDRGGGRAKFISELQHLGTQYEEFMKAAQLLNRPDLWGKAADREAVQYFDRLGYLAPKPKEPWIKWMGRGEKEYGRKLLQLFDVWEKVIGGAPVVKKSRRSGGAIRVSPVGLNISKNSSIQQLEQYLELRPDDVLAWLFLGRSLSREGRIKESADAWRHATALAPADWDAWYNLGCALLDLERFGDAETAFRESTKLAFWDGAGWWNLGIALGNQGKIDGNTIHCLGKGVTLSTCEKFDSEQDGVLGMIARGRERTVEEIAAGMAPDCPFAPLDVKIAIILSDRGENKKAMKVLCGFFGFPGQIGSGADQEKK